MKIQSKLFLAISFLLITTFSFSQEKFENEKLALVNDIFHNTTRENIVSYMENKHFDTDKVEKTEYLKSGVEIEEELVFSFYLENEGELEKIEILYGKNKKIVEVTYDFYGAANTSLIEKELKDKKYKSKIDNFEILGSTVTHYIWRKSRNKNSFRTYSDSLNNTGELTYGIIE